MKSAEHQTQPTMGVATCAQCTTECHLRLSAAPLSAGEQNNQKLSTVQLPLRIAVSLALACRYLGSSSQSARPDRNWKRIRHWVETRQCAPSFTQSVSPVLRGVFSWAGLRWKRWLCREQWNRGAGKMPPPPNCCKCFCWILFGFARKRITFFL